jgi:hypothetical protein
MCSFSASPVPSRATNRWSCCIEQVAAAVTGSWQVCDSSRELTIERGVALRVVPGMEVI